MNLEAGVLLVLAVCCIGIAVLQASEWRGPMRWVMALAIAAALAALGESASRTSIAEVLRWAASAQHRQDLAALLLAEALLFGNLAARQAQGRMGSGWRWLGWLPAPSALLSLFFAQVAVMLRVDGWDYDTLSWLCALGFVALLAAVTAGLRWALPGELERCTLRLGLHGAQALAGLWLASPAFRPAADPVPLWGERLAIVAIVVAALAGLGWSMQRLRGAKR